MKITKELLKELYEEYNQTYFGGVLGKCEFSLFPKTVCALGKFNDREDNKGRAKDRIWIGTSVIWNEDLLRNVMIHEMAHLYVRRIDNCRFDGLLGHGRRFRKQVRRIKKEFGIDIDTKSWKVDWYNPDFYPKRWEKILLWIIDR